MIGRVKVVDTGSVIVEVPDDADLADIQVNQFVWIRSTRVNERIMGIVVRIMSRKVESPCNDAMSANTNASPSCQGDEPQFFIRNGVYVELFGTWRVSVPDFGLSNSETLNQNAEISDCVGVFRRALDVVPSIDADVNVLTGDELARFMRSLTNGGVAPLRLGTYALANDATAELDGNRFFQRHAAIVGGTGSGKSYTVATILEQAANLKSANALVFDIHGEYATLETENVVRLKIAGPSDSPDTSGVLFLPYWLFSYEEAELLLLERKDSNASNQASVLMNGICVCKQKSATYVNMSKNGEFDITVESPIPYRLSDLTAILESGEGKKVGGENSGKAKMTNLVSRLEIKRRNKRLNFIFNDDPKLQETSWLKGFVRNLIGFGKSARGVKIIDFSEVPADLLPLAAGLVARLVFSLQLWTVEEARQPMALFCEEAHLYMVDSDAAGIAGLGARSFARIAREGRKYGMSLVVISQRPSELNKTVLSQCGTVVAMRLTNLEDQNTIRRLLPDNMGGIASVLPILDVGEALVVGDACPIPSRIRIKSPVHAPRSVTVDIWSKWTASDSGELDVDRILRAMCLQRKNVI